MTELMGNLLKRIVVVLALACAGLGAGFWAGSGPALAQSEYKVKSGDTLAIEVLEDASLNRVVVVLPDGRFSFPLAGTLLAQGLSVPQIHDKVASALAPNFADRPTVFVSANPAPPKLSAGGAVAAATIDIYLMGEVAAPGLKEVAPGTTFLQALAQSGGLTSFAATKRIQLRQGNPPRVQVINYKAISEGAVMTQDPVLQEGDVILVPERRLFE